MVVAVMGGGDLMSTNNRERAHLVNQSVAFPPDPTPVRKEAKNRKEAKTQIIQSSVNHVIARNHPTTSA